MTTKQILIGVGVLAVAYYLYNKSTKPETFVLEEKNSNASGSKTEKYKTGVGGGGASASTVGNEIKHPPYYSNRP